MNERLSRTNRGGERMSASVERQLGMAVIGAGLLGSRHARAWAEQPETRLITVMDLNAKRAETVADRHGARSASDLAAILSDPQIDAVSVVTPDHLHRDAVVACLEAGKHVFVEKPLATDLEQAREMVAVSRRTKRLLQVNFSQRFVSEFAFIKQTIARGEIGRPVMIQSLKHDTLYVPTEMIPWAHHTSPVYFMTSHDLDLIRWYLGAEPVTVVAHEVRGKLDQLGVPVHDGLQGLVRFSDATAVQFHTSWIHPNTFPSVSDGYLEIIGTEGVLIYRSRSREIELYTNRDSQTIKFGGPGTAKEVGGKLTGAFVDSLRLFIRSIREQTVPMTEAADSLKTVACQIALLESARQGGVPMQVK
jgi:predicted dehydrogenase